MTITILLTKVCSRCKIEKGITEYHKRPDRPDGIVSHCKQCEKERKSKMAEEVKAYSKKYYEENKESVCKRSALKAREKIEYINKLKEKPCTDCGQSFPGRPEVMDFDHREPHKKSFNISNGSWRTYADIDEEVSKCDLVCANCHRTRTKKNDLYRQANTRRWEKKKSADCSALSVNDIVSDII